MPIEEAQIKDLEDLLRPFSSILSEPFRESLAKLPPDLPVDRLRFWVESGVDLAGHAERSWEAAAAYFQAGLSLLPTLDEAELRSWVTAGRDLAEDGPQIATAYFQASPQVLPLLGAGETPEWAAIARRLHAAPRKPSSLATDFLTLSHQLLQQTSFADLKHLSHVLEGIARRSPEPAVACLQALPTVLEGFEPPERGPFVDLAVALANESVTDTALYLQRCPELLAGIEPFQRAHYLQFGDRVVRRLGRQTYSLLTEGARALSEVPVPYHGRIIDLADRLTPLSAGAAIAWIKNAPYLCERLGIEEMELWYTTGYELFEETGAGAETYFRLESNKAEEMIHTLTARVDLSQVADVLRLYGKALTGANLSVHSTSSIADKGIGWVSENGASTDGTSIYLPEHIEEFDNKRDNLSIFKVYATHQAGHLEFGSFKFAFRSEGGVLPLRRDQVEAQRRAQGLLTRDSWLTDMERFFDLFDDRRLAADLFTLAEDLRVDSRIRQEYSGIRSASRRVQEIELSRRPNTYFLPLRQAFVENLVRSSLEGKASIGWPRNLAPLLLQALDVLDKMRDPAATVADTAEAALLLYELAEQVPNLPAGDGTWMDWMSIEELEEQGMNLRRSPLEGEEFPYHSPDQISFHGDFKPELVQLLDRMRTEDESDEDSELGPLAAEQIKQLLEKSVELETPDEIDIAELSQILQNLKDEAARKEELAENPDAPSQVLASPDRLLPFGIKTFHYDEWDYQASDYRPRWAAVHERRMSEGDDVFFEKTLQEHAGLVRETQRLFELLKPETFSKIKRLEDGEDIDLDEAIQFVIQKRAGHGENGKVYWRRNKTERNVAVAFLIDLSSSTEEEIDRLRPTLNPNDPEEMRRYYQWIADSRSRGSTLQPKRIIDLEKESLVLLTAALEVIGDRYGIFGFSGQGRENVEYYVIKDFEERLGDDIRRRIEHMSPLRSTRMGPAIRHTITKLLAVDARARILFLVSDGRPQDEGYGRDGTAREYAIHDTHRALQEAKQKHITPFALTFDKEGHEYLGQMCGDIAYEVLSNIELLPSRLPTLYRMLTE